MTNKILLLLILVWSIRKKISHLCNNIVAIFNYRVDTEKKNYYILLLELHNQLHRYIETKIYISSTEKFCINETHYCNTICRNILYFNIINKCCYFYSAKSTF